MLVQSMLCMLIVGVSLHQGAGATYVYAKDQIDKAHERLSHYPSKHDFVQHLDESLTQNITKIELSDEYQEKSQMLYRMFHEMTEHKHNISREDVNFIVKLIKYKRKKIARVYRRKFDQYIEKGSRLKLAVQFYKNKHTYIHLGHLDPKGKKGGYKTFSRSIDFDTLQIYANLSMDLYQVKKKYQSKDEIREWIKKESFKKRVSRRMDEFRTMKFFKFDSRITDFRDIAAFAWLEEGQLKMKLICQMILFDGDLRSINGQSFVRTKLRYALAASESLNVMHKNYYLHLDIKPDNYFLSSTKGQGGILVLGDLGFATTADNPKFGPHLLGTHGYVDPSVCLRVLSESRPFDVFASGVAADKFALGSIFVRMVDSKFELRSVIRSLNKESFEFRSLHKDDDQYILSQSKALEWYDSYIELYKRLIASDLATLGYDPDDLALLKIGLSLMHYDIDQRPSLDEVELLLRALL